MSKALKTYVIDTNIVLHDYMSIYKFEEHNVVIPITVLEEIDKFKKGNNLINLHAREFSRELDSIAGDSLFEDGLDLGKGRGKLFVVTGKEFSEEIKKSFSEPTADHKILAITHYLQKNSVFENVILISKDINLRLKAKSIGIHSEDYRSDKVDEKLIIDKKTNNIEGVDEELINELYASEAGMDIEKSNLNINQNENQYFILKNDSASVLTKYTSSSKKINKIDKKDVYGIHPRNAEQAFAIDALLDKNIDLIAITGKAGTGKTLLALAAALAQSKSYNQILLSRPIVALANKDLGFLPGDVSDKIGPYMQPLFDNLNFIKNKYNIHSKDYLYIDELLSKEKLIITPLAYIRGRSLSNVYFIVDEAQNLTPHEIKTIITRAGEDTKMIFTGDIEQIDSPYLDRSSNGLAYLTDKMKNQKLFTHINLIKGERSKLAELASNVL